MEVILIINVKMRESKGNELIVMVLKLFNEK